MPPNILPSSITNEKGYKIIFGKNNFEVILKGGKLETVRPIQGCLYRFRKSSDSLLIEESAQISNASDINGCWEDSLELLNISQISTWGDALPRQLKQSYSHWLSRKRNVVLFRSKDFRNRCYVYLHSMTACKRCNVFEQRDSSDGIRLERLFIHDSPILSILERIEAREMIHTFLVPSALSIKHLVIFELYRFCLKFSLELDSGVLKCLTIVGYQLAPIQHLEGLFPGLRNYLILENSSDASLKKIIVPFGTIIRNDDHSMIIELSTKDLSPTCNNVDEEMQYFQYDINPRFGSLDANNFRGRLFLAALFAATISNVPDPVLGMTSEEQACILIRQCQVNTPFTPIEMKCLHNLMSLSRGRSSTLSLLSHDLQRSAFEFDFLHNPSDSTSTEVFEIDQEAISYDASAYLAMDDNVSSRVILTSGESRRIIGSVKPQKSIKARRRDHLLLDIGKSPITRDDINVFYTSVSKLWVKDSCKSGDRKEFPLYHSANTDLEKAVYGELQESWNMHCEEMKSDVNPVENIIAAIKHIEKSAASALSTIEKYILNALTHHDPSQSHLHSRAMDYLKLINVIPTATKHEIAALACDSSKIIDYNPLLSKTSTEIVRQAVIIWLELCVLQDKFSFLLSSGRWRKKEFMRELTSQRSWDTNIHAYWLVYEAEQGIRIRPEQYEVANHLINNNGHVIQLNMGLGKTRVILPMLILYYSYRPFFERIPRLHILSTLLSEVCEHFHNTLGASVLKGRLFTLPFRRSVQLDVLKVQSMLDLVRYCKEERGFFVVTPEHRLSLELKVKELYLDDQKEMSESLGQVVSGCWQDVYDEVDEILHHRFQLVYSIGSVKAQPDMIHRWKAAQALLKLLRSERCQVQGIVVVIKVKELEAFPWITVEDDVDSEDFKRQMALTLFDQPPLEYTWIATHKKRDEMIKVVSEASANPMHLESKLSSGHFKDILALRGLLAHEILLHCLKKRYRVDFGPNHLNSRKKLAVPYRGADMPSERSEFSHPDCAMLLSILAYYSSGLSKNDLKAAFASLLRKGCNFKKSTYENWLSESRIRMEETTYNAVNKIDKIDLTNKSQFHVLYEHFHKNPETINYFLNATVFPRYLDHYPQRLIATPWHLASNKDGCAIGFSGTNDNHLILPLQLKKYLPWGTYHSIWRSLLSTNGKMLDLVINKTRVCKELGDGRANELLLHFISTDKSIDALIDCGALLAGISNRHVADHLATHHLPYSNSNLKGITFYDESTKEWMVLERSRRCLPKNQSSLKDKDTFALFDEPRCRGVDLKLRSDAVAILTLGQGMCKDKFMQAAGRMRQLHDEQSLIIVGENRIFNEIRKQSAREDCGTVARTYNEVEQRNAIVDVTGILTWVIQNT
eukprot:scaffold823_cov145-Chaetoceros_neogracile.AAC.3